MNNILFINQDSGYLMIDIINAHADAGHKCTLITGRLVERNTPLHPSVKVDSITRYNRTTTAKRLLTWLLAFFQIWFRIIFKYRKHQLFIVSNPPFAPLLPLWVKNSFRLLIYDIYPDVITQSGYIKKTSILAKVWTKANKRVFEKADKVFTISDGMRQRLAVYTGKEKIDVVPVWSDNFFFKPIPRSENRFLKQHNLESKFIVLYSGNLGQTHPVELLPNLAAINKTDEVCFLIIGHGDKEKRIRKMIEQLKLDNCILMPWQSADILPYSFAAANIGVVSLGDQVSSLSVPSKTFNLMSAGIPLICLTSPESELARIVTKYDNGRCFLPDELDKVHEYIQYLYTNRVELHRLSQNSLKASNDFGVENAKKFL